MGDISEDASVGIQTGLERIQGAKVMDYSWASGAFGSSEPANDKSMQMNPQDCAAARDLDAEFDKLKASMDASSDKRAETPKRREDSEGVKRAIMNYSEHHNKRDVEASEVDQSPEGMAYWSTKAIPIAAPSAMHQQFMRALRWDDHARAIYEGLPDSDKMAYKREWCVDKDFQFTTVKKIYRNSYKTTTGKRGRMLSIYSMANELGGWTIPECRNGALRYAKMCDDIDPVNMTSNSSWTGLKMFLFVEHLVSTQSVQEWEKTVENLTTEPNTVWLDKSELNKAKISYAAFSGKKVVSSILN